MYVVDYRWRKDIVRYTSMDATDGGSRQELEEQIHLEGNLASEATSVIIDSLDVVVQVALQFDSLQHLLSSCLKLVLHILTCNQSATVLQKGV